MTAKAIDNENYSKISSSIKIRVISGTTNLALNQPVVASSSESGTDNIASHIVDGDMFTRWASEGGSPQWIYIDLGFPNMINQVVLYWEYARSMQYEIQISEDSTEWSTIYIYTESEGDVDNITFTPKTTRYVRIYSTAGLAPEWNISLYEIEIYYDSNINSIDKKSEVSKEFTLSQNYPNPFNPATTITYNIPKTANVSINIYNILGQKVCTLVSDINHQPGLFKVIWDGTNDFGKPVVSGIYLYTLTVDNRLNETKKNSIP